MFQIDVTVRPMHPTDRDRFQAKSTIVDRAMCLVDSLRRDAPDGVGAFEK